MVPDFAHVGFTAEIPLPNQGFPAWFLGKGQELAAAKAVLGQVPLEGRIVVADALLTQREVCQQIVAGGGDYLLPVKENQPALRRDLVEAFSPTGK